MSAVLVVLLALLAAPALAQTPDTVFLEELTWPELRALVAAGKTTIILPIGGTEQNGPHMALGKHNVRVHGFRNIVFLGDHGSTQAGEKAVAAKLNREWATTPARAHAIEEYYRAATAEFRELLRARGFKSDELGEHAAVPDTSLTLAIDPKLVRKDAPTDARVAGAGTGVDGDPRRASAELGVLGVDLIVNRTVAAIKASTDRH